MSQPISREEALFNAAADLVSAAERAALRAAVDELLSAVDEAAHL